MNLIDTHPGYQHAKRTINSQRSMEIIRISVALSFIVLCTSAQVPRVCSDVQSLTNKICCPQTQDGVCGIDAGRGQCVTVSSLCFTEYAEGPGPDYRLNWPLSYYTQVCNCTGNYGGYDCSECDFGYTGTNCQEKLNKQRKSVIKQTAGEWKSYNEQLAMAKTTNSRYVILIPQSTCIRSDFSTATVRNISVYGLFVWMHAYSAQTNKDDYEPSSSADDYAHESVGFLTWHRLLLLTIEREMQVLLNDSSFSIPYWDWTDFEGQTDWNTLLFSDDKLGSHDENGTISGSYYSGDNWQTTCWPPPSTEFCDPSMHGIQPIIRCSNNTACTAVAELFPSRRDVIRALTQYQVWADPDNEDYDPFNKYAKNSFCNFLEGFELQPRENADPYLSSSITVNGTLKSMNRALHNVGHIVVGIGNLNTPATPEGTMADVAASVNDPVFINHHSMIDCIFDQWLELYPDSPFVGPVQQRRFAGHGVDDCIVPFYPPKTHRQMYKIGLDFGFECDLPKFVTSTRGSGSTTVPLLIVLTLSLVLCWTVMLK